MTNQEIIEKLNELDKQQLNACDFYLELKAFKKQYKKSDFYKQTHLSLNKLVKINRQQRYLKYSNMDLFFIDLQEHIDDLDTDHLIEIFEKAENYLGKDYQNNIQILNALVSNFTEGGTTEIRGE